MHINCVKIHGAVMVGCFLDFILKTFSILVTTQAVCISMVFL
jgi:hypothetical protein